MEHLGKILKTLVYVSIIWIVSSVKVKYMFEKTWGKFLKNLQNSKEKFVKDWKKF